MTGPKGNSEFCFPETLNVPRGEAEGNIEVETLREGTLGCLWYVHRSKQFFSRSLRSHTRRGPLAHRSSHVRTTKQICPCVICSTNSARYCFGIVYHCSAMVEVLGK